MSKVKVSFGTGTLPVKPCGLDTGYSFVLSLSNFIWKLLMMRGETLFILGQGVKCHGQPCPPPPLQKVAHFALSSYTLC